MEQIKNKIDSTWDEMLKKQASEEYKRVFGDISLPRMSEKEFYKWWDANKDIPYSTYYYDVACCFWNTEYIFDQIKKHETTNYKKTKRTKGRCI